MQIKFTDGEQEHFNRLRTLHTEAQRQFNQLDAVLRGFLNCVAANRGLKDTPGRLLEDGSGLEVPEPLQLDRKGDTPA